MTCGKNTRHTKSIQCCPLCKELFSSDSAWQKHRTRRDTDGRKGCRLPDEAGLVPKPSKTAPGEVIWSLPGNGRWAA